jgi:signal peptidase I
LAVAVTAWLLLAPPRLGGSTSYVTIVGSSMEPRLHRGDLVLARRASDYRVGEVVLYRSRSLGRYVLHRIVGREGDRYVFKGDNNGFLDPDRPTKADLVGRIWLRIPAVGNAVGWLRVSWHAALVAGLAALLLLGAGAGLATRGRGRRQAVPAEPRRVRVGSLSPLGAGWQALALPAACALAFFASAAVAFARPTHRLVSQPYEQRGAFGYSARAVAGSVYPGGALTTGDPAFLRLVNNLSLVFRYHFVATSPHAVGGEERLLVRVEDPTTNWRRTLTLQPWRQFSGDRFRASGTLPLVRLRSLIGGVERLTGVHRESYTLTVLAQVALRGTLAGGKLHERFSPSLAFALDPLVLRLAPSASLGRPASPLTPSRMGAVEVLRASSLSALGLRIEVARARRLGLLAGGLALAAGLLLSLLLLVRGLRLDEPARIAARYGPLLIPVSLLPSTERRGDERGHQHQGPRPAGASLGAADHARTAQRRPLLPRRARGQPLPVPGTERRSKCCRVPGRARSAPGDPGRGATPAAHPPLTLDPARTEGHANQAPARGVDRARRAPECGRTRFRPTRRGDRKPEERRGDLRRLRGSQG